MTAIIAAATTRKDCVIMPFTIEFRNIETNQPLGGVSYISQRECREIYEGLGNTVDSPPQFSAVLMDEDDATITAKDVDAFDVKVLLGIDELS